MRTVSNYNVVECSSCSLYQNEEYEDSLIHIRKRSVVTPHTVHVRIKWNQEKFESKSDEFFIFSFFFSFYFPKRHQNWAYIAEATSILNVDYDW